MAGVVGGIPYVAPALVGILILGLISITNAQFVSPLLVVLAIPAARPNILGESLSAVAATLIFLAAILALVDDRGYVRVGTPSVRSLRSVGFWLAMSYAWLLFITTISGSGTSFQPLLQSVVLVVGVVVATSFVLADPQRRRVVAWGFVGLVLLQCASFAVTVMLWRVSGIGTGLVARIPGTMHSYGSAVYFPGTVTTATQTVLGFTFPRFNGIGREPGWMAMWCAFTYFLIPTLTQRRMRFARFLLLLGLLGTFSTAGFGVFITVWAFEAFIRPRSGATLLFRYGRQVTGVLVMGAALWLAIRAPVFGLNAKSTMNEISLSDRFEATRAGWQALQTSPLLGSGSGGQSGINLIASIAVGGIPLLLFILAALFMPLRTHPARWLAAAPVAVLALTLLTSQPPIDSTWVYVAALLAFSVTLPSRPQGNDKAAETDLARAAPSHAGEPASLEWVPSASM